MMSTIAGSMMTVVGVTFSMILVVLALASSQYTSRILRNFMRSRITQIVLGIFAGIFTYCLIVLRTIRSGDSPWDRYERGEKSAVSADAVAGYELFREFDHASLALVEPLRALRIVYTSAWIARRWDDPSFRTGFPAFGTETYWVREYEELFAIYESLSPGLTAAGT